MKKILSLLLVFSILLGLGSGIIPVPVATAESSDLEYTGRKIAFNDDWRFYLGDNPDAKNNSFDDSDWRSLSLPHDWSIEFDFDRNSPSGGGGGFLNGGTGWYRKSFVLPETMKGKRVSIDFGGIYMDSSVYVNGVFVGNYPYGYSPFSYDITDFVNTDGVTENVIAIKVDHKQPSSRWYSGSGIYRNVNLTVTNPVSVTRYGTFVTTPNLEEHYGNGKGLVDIKTKIKNANDNSVATAVRSTVYNENEEIVANSKTSEIKAIESFEVIEFSQELEVPTPKLWDSENPNLYYVLTEVLVDGEVTDTYKTDFGFRWFDFDPNGGFSLNGEKMKLQGVCMHHDQGSLGAAAYYRSIERQMEIMKEMGVNAIRVTHNPAADELIEICNKLGLMVIDEAFDCWESGKRQYDYGRFFNKPATHPDAKENMTWAEFDLKNMVERGKNDPSIIMWSIGNEIVGASVATATRLHNYVKEIDTTRPTTQGFNNFIDGFNPNSTYAKVADVVDVANFNYGENSYDSAHSSYPDWNIVGGETSSATRSRGIYSHPGEEKVAHRHDDYQQSSYDVDRVGWGRTMQNAVKAYRDREFISGEFVWTGFDYIGEPTPYFNEWPSKSSYFGIVDTAGFLKDAYYMYQSQWLSMEDNPMVHMLPHWNWKEGVNVVMNIYSNAPKVELFLNDVSLGEKAFLQKTTNYGTKYQETAAGDLFLRWDVPFKAGTLKAVAKDLDGNIVATDIVKTAGEAAGMKLSADREVIAADGYDLSYITVDIVDKDGNFVPTANNLVNFEISGNGEIVGVDNGNAIAVDERYKDTKRKAFSGKVLVIVKSTKNAGSFTLTTNSLGLSSNQITGFTVAPEDVEKDILLGYEENTIDTMVGQAPVLPSTVTAMYNLSGKKEIAVVWDSIPEGTVDKTGTFTLSGKVSETGDTVTASINVIGIAGIKDYTSVTALNVVPDLPETAKVVYTDGSQKEMPVTWERKLTVEDVKEIGKVVIKGKVEGIDDFTAKATVRVQEVTYDLVNISRNSSNTGYPTAIKSYEQGKDYAKNINDGDFDGASRWTNWTADSSRRNDWVGIDFGEEKDVVSLDIWFFVNNDCKVPVENIVEYWDGTDWKPVENQDKKYAADFVADQKYKNTISFDEVRTSKIRLNMTCESLNYGLIELEVNSWSKEVITKPDTNTDLLAITLDNEPIENFKNDKTSYAFELEYADALPKIAATLPSDSNASVFVVQAPNKNGKAIVEVTAEDGKTTKIFTVSFNELPAKLEKVNLSTITDNPTEDDVLDITLDALLENGEKLSNDVADIKYTVNNGTGRISVENGKVLISGAGTASLQVSVTYDGITVKSNIINFTIKENPNQKTIVGYEEVKVVTEKGVAPKLPAEITAVYDVGLPKKVEVTWNSIDESLYGKFGEFKVEGKVVGQELKAVATVIVKGVTGIQNFSTSTAVGIAPELSDRVKVYFSDGTMDTFGVKWNDYAKENLKTENTFTVKGVVQGILQGGNDSETTVSIRVSKTSEKGDNYLGYKNGFYWPTPFASFTNKLGQDSIHHLNDNIISHERVGNVNRWGNWTGTARSEDFVGVILGKEQAEKKYIDNIEIDFYTDELGTNLPSDYTIEYFIGDSIDTPRESSELSELPSGHMLRDDANWAEVPNLVKPETLTEKNTTYFTFDAVETFAIRIRMTAETGKSLGITEMKGFERLVEKFDTFAVEEITVNNTPISDFDPNNLEYTVDIKQGIEPVITASADKNASVTIVYPPDAKGIAKIIVTAENGVNTKTYQIKFNETSTPEELDTSFLKFLVNYADELIENGKLDETLPVIVERFKAELKKAKELLAKASADPSSIAQTEINKMAEDLLNVVSLIEFKGNNTRLQRLISMSAKYVAEKETYTGKTYTPFETALESAKSVLADEIALQDEIDEAWNNLAYAVAGLRKIPNKDILRESLNKAKSIDKMLYTPASYKNLEVYKKEADNVINNKNSTQDEVDTTNKNLVNALNDLVPLAGTSTSTTTENITSKETSKATNNKVAPKTGETSIVTFVTLIVLLSISATIIIRKKKQTKR